MPRPGRSKKKTVQMPVKRKTGVSNPPPEPSPGAKVTVNVGAAALTRTQARQGIPVAPEGPEKKFPSVEERRATAAANIAPAAIERQVAAQEKTAKCVERIADTLDAMLTLSEQMVFHMGMLAAAWAAEPPNAVEEQQPKKVVIATTAQAAKAAGVRLPHTNNNAGGGKVKVIKPMLVSGVAKMLKMSMGGRK